MRRWIVTLLCLCLAAPLVVGDPGHDGPQGRHGPPDGHGDKGEDTDRGGHGHPSGQADEPAAAGQGPQGDKGSGHGKPSQADGHPGASGPQPGHNESGRHAKNASAPPDDAPGSAAEDEGARRQAAGRGAPAEGDATSTSAAETRSSRSPAGQGQAQPDPGREAGRDSAPAGAPYGLRSDGAIAADPDALLGPVLPSPAPESDERPHEVAQRPGPHVDGAEDADGLQGAPGVQVPDHRPDLTSVAQGPVSETVLAIAAFVVTSASLGILGTVQAFRRTRSGPMAVTKAERQEIRRLAKEAAEEGLDEWTWSRPETYEGLRDIHPETVAFWTGSDVTDVARWQGEEPGPGEEKEESVAERARPGRAPMIEA